MNIRRLRALQRMVLKYADHYDQNDWGGAGYFDDRGVPQCGSLHCLGGLAEGRWGNTEDFFGSAQPALGLTLSEADRLFSGVPPTPDKEHWGGYAAAYRKAKTARGRARVAFRRIERFIQSGGTV